MKKYKAILFAVLSIGILFLFFTSELPSLEIEKNAIITAIGIDYKDNNYAVTAQIALPESKPSSSKNDKTIIEGSASTVSGAIKDLGATSGWYPKLSFCNLILIGSDLFNDNMIKYVDYFANTLKIQYSALLVACDGKAKDFLTASTPLDNISSFAIQKIVLKQDGYTKNAVDTDIKSFCSSYYNKSSSSLIPLIKMNEIKSNGSTSSEQGGQEGGSGQKLFSFDASTTLLIKNGFIVGTLNEKETLAYNVIVKSHERTLVSVDDVLIDGKKANYLLTVLSSDCNYNLDFNNSPIIKINAEFYVRIDDQNSDNSLINLTEKVYLPNEVKVKAEQDLYKTLTTLVEKSKNTNCDIFNLTELLYRHYNDKFALFKDSIILDVVPQINVQFIGLTR